MFWVWRNLACLLLALITPATEPAGTTTAEQAAGSLRWVGAYVPGWAQDDSAQFQAREFESINYLLQFGVYVRPHGRLDLRSNELTPNKMRALVAEGHASGRKVLLVVGGEGADTGLRIACSPKNLTHTIQALSSLVESYGYDGIDMDWEPFPAANAPLYAQAIQSLRKSLDGIAGRRSRPLVLSTAIEVDLNDEPYMRSLTENLAELSRYLDQINLMTYTMADPTNLPFVWHNSALYPARSSPKPGFRTPNADGAVRAFIAAGLEPSRLGIGINLHGYVWRSSDKSKPEDLSEPGKIWKARPEVSELTYDQLLSQYFNSSRYRWDNEAQVPYLRIPETGTFVSYEDGRSIRQKVAYVRSHQLGGIIIWDTGGTRQRNGNRRLLQMVDDAIRESSPNEHGDIGSSSNLTSKLCPSCRQQTGVGR
jgi:chitinase